MGDLVDEVVSFYNDILFPNNPSVLSHMRTYFRRLSHRGFTPLRILHVGPGTGEEVSVIKDMFPESHIVCVEPSFESAKILRANCSFAKVFDVDIEHFTSLLTAEQTFDLIVCQGVLHHLRDPGMVLSRLLRSLAPGGELWLGVYHHARWDYPINKELATTTELFDYERNPRERTYSHDMLYRLISAGGGRVVRYAHPLPRPRGRLWCILCDLLFIWRRQPMIFVSVMRC